MKAKAKELSAALSRILPVLKTRTTWPILSCAKLEAKEDTLTAYATDMDAFSASSCPCQGDLEPVCVDATLLNYMVHHAVDDVELKLTDRRLVVEGSGTAHLVMHDPAEFPAWPQEKATPLGLNTADLAACIKGVAWATEPNPKITVDIWREVVWVKTTEKTLECAGTDGKEFAYVKQAGIAAPSEFIFPAKQASLLVDALLVGGGDIKLSENWVSTESASLRVAVKLAQGKYIPVDYLLKQEARPIGVFQICRLVDTLQTIKALGHGEAWMPCVLDLEAEQVRVSYQGNNNRFDRCLPHQLEGEPCRIKFDTEKALSVFSHVQPGAKASMNDRTLRFDDGDYTYSLALIRGD